MSIKSMKRDEWSRVVEKKVIIENISCDDYKGKIALLKILKVSSPLYVNYGDIRVKIADDDYTWLQIGLENQYFWITATFDENNQLFNIYVDMTDGNIVGSDNPYFVDMYLDYVILNDTVLELDRDELEDALSKGEITRTQFERTLSEGEKVFSFLKSNRQELKDFVQRERNRLTLQSR